MKLNNIKLTSKLIMKMIIEMRRNLYDKYRHEIKRWIYSLFCKDLPVVTEIGF